MNDITTPLTKLIDHGKSREEIYLDLIHRGFTVADIEQAYQEIARGGERTRTQKKASQMVLTLGALLVGFGVFSFIAANWRVIGAEYKIAIIIFAMLLAYLAGWLIREQTPYKRTGNAVLFLGNILYGAGIFLVGQIFHVPANWPDGLILWMLGTVVVGLVIEERLAIYLSIALGLIVAVIHPFLLADDLSGDPFLFTSAWLLAAAAVTSFYLTYKFTQKVPRLTKQNY